MSSCHDCGKARDSSAFLRCAECHEKRQQRLLAALEPKEATFQELSDHWTMPEDPDTKAGWGIFNFDWLMKPYKEAVEWHDRVTSKGSEAQQMGITNERINIAWRDMLDEMHRTTPKAGFVKRIGWFAGFFVSKINRYFYEGPLK